MSGTFRDSRTTTLLVVSLVVAAVHRSDGYPYQWGDFFSRGEIEDPSSTISKEDYRRETSVSGEIASNEHSPSIENEENGNARANGEGTAKRRTGLSEEDDREDEEEDDEQASRDDEDEEKIRREEKSKDAIARLIEQALRDDVFLTPEKWAETLVDEPFDTPEDEEDTVAKVQKTRSPADRPGEAARTGNSTSAADRIVFPDDSRNQKLKAVAKSPVPSCADSTFCLNPPYYPSAGEIEDALKKRYLDPVTEPPLISERIGPMDDDNGLCVSVEQIIQPKTALDDSKEWRYILNNENYVQTVRVELCRTKDGACQIIDDIASGYKTSCKQKYIYRHLVAIGTNGTASIPFQIPSSCCCHVKFDGNPMLRIGLSLGKRKQQTPVPDRSGN